MGDFVDHNGGVNCLKCAESLYRCAKCNRPIKGEYLFSKEDRFHPHCVQYSKCSKCGDLIVASEVVALGSHYHPHCFTCADCGSELPAKFYNRDGSAICENCNKKGGGTTSSGTKIFCGKCNRAITDTFVSYEGKSFHDDCFTCYSCRKVLPLDNFYNVERNPHCYDCATRSMNSK